MLRHVAEATRFPRQVRLVSSSSTSAVSRTVFTKVLEDGPSLDDFITQPSSDRVILGNNKG